MGPMNPRRAWFSASALAIALLVVAVVTATVLEPHTRNFARFQAAGVWKIDFHVQSDPEVLGYAVNWAASQGILGMVLLDAGTVGGGLEQRLEAAARFPGRVLVFMTLDGRGCCGPEWADRETARLVQGRAAGARGLHVPERLGAPGEAPVPLDHPGLSPIWEAARGLELPVAVHAGSGPDSRAAMARAVERNPAIPFVALQMAGLGGDPGELSRLLDRLPNLLVGTAGAIPEMARHPEAMRELLVARSDRFLLGTDLTWMQGPRPELRALVIGSGPPVRSTEQVLRYFDTTWRFYETLETAIPGPGAGDPPVSGLGLPREALERLYRGNARRLLGFGDLEAR